MVSEAFSNLRMSRTLRANNFSCRHLIALFPKVTPEQVIPMAMLSRPCSFSQASSFFSKLMPTLLSLPVHFVWCISQFVLFWPSPAEGVVVLQWRAVEVPSGPLSLHGMLPVLLSENQDCFALWCHIPCPASRLFWRLRLPGFH